MTFDDPIAKIEATLGNAALQGWQFAADGRWDRNKRLLLGEDVTQINAWLDDQTADDIAAEVLLRFPDSEMFFFGVRFTHLSRDGKKKFIQALLRSGTNTTTLTQAVQLIRDSLQHQNIAMTPPEYLELGVFDLWNRVKSLVVWRPGEDLIMPEGMPAKTQRPDDGFVPLHEPQPKHLMLEAAWKRKPEQGQDFQCWLGLPVSEKRSEKHVLSKQKYIATARILSGS